MKIFVVYDSVFGNTEKIARAIGGAFPAAQTTVARVGDAGAPPAGTDLMIVGSPTRGFRPTPAIQNYLRALPSLRGVKVAAFDTRIAVEEVHNMILSFFVSIFGYAAKPIADGLVKKGGELVLPAEGFFVQGSEGPLKEGELERAAKWASALQAKFADS
jgi:flavodoxin